MPSFLSMAEKIARLEAGYGYRLSAAGKRWVQGPPCRVEKHSYNLLFAARGSNGCKTWLSVDPAGCPDR